jgi:hypothetical protein
MRISQLKTKVTASGIRTGAQITDESVIATLEIYAKPCSPHTFELRLKEYDGTKWVCFLKDSLPVSFDFDLEDITHVGALSGYIKRNGHVVSKPANA